MNYYRIRCKPRTVWLTPWQADTLFGQMCWAVLHEEGEKGLTEFLEPFMAGRPPFVLSNGFPGDLLPRPMLPPAPTQPRPKVEAVAAMTAAKKEKSARLVSPEDFHRIRKGERPPVPDPAPDGFRAQVELKNQINRITGTTTPPEGEPTGNLFSRTHLALPKGVDEISIYVGAGSEEGANRALALLRRVSEGGYGAKKSSGYGAFTVLDMQPLPDWSAPLDGANGIVTLSNFVPAAGDPVNGTYDTLVKYGKLGEELATAGTPFKFPVLMVQAGGVFRDSNPRPFYGRMVNGVHPDSRIVQYGYALALPLRLPN